MKWWHWLLAALAIALGGCLWVYFRARGQAVEASRALASATAEWHRVEVARKRAEVEKLMESFDQNDARVQELLDSIDAKRERLAARYADQGLSDEEIVARFNRIGL